MNREQTLICNEASAKHLENPLYTMYISREVVNTGAGGILRHDEESWPLPKNF
jgi:hypothetical protein